ncbi:MAG: acetyl esterase/lipase [Planctomycetota bacterium]|jgi:acetyl esterase/lipase
MTILSSALIVLTGFLASAQGEIQREGAPSTLPAQTSQGSGVQTTPLLRCAPPTSWPTSVPIPGGGGRRFVDVPYWSGTTQTLDVYLPLEWNGGGDRQTIVYFHGGGGFSGDKYNPSIVEFFAGMVRDGYPVVSVNTTLAPPNCSTGSSPQSVQEARAAIDFVRRASAPGMPAGSLAGQDVCLPNCIVVVGSSFGALQAAQIGVLDGANDGSYFNPGIPKGNYRADLCVIVSGPTDLYDWGANGACPPSECYGAPYNVSFPDSGACGGLSGWSSGYPTLSVSDWAAAFGGGLPNGCWPSENTLACQWGSACSSVTPPALPSNILTGNAFADFSPQNWIDPGDSAFYLLQGRCDPLVPFSQSESFFDALLLAGVPVWANHMASKGHGIQAIGGLLTPAEAVVEVQAAIGIWAGSDPSNRPGY